MVDSTNKEHVTVTTCRNLHEEFSAFRCKCGWWQSDSSEVCNECGQVHEEVPDAGCTCDLCTPNGGVYPIRKPTAIRGD